MKKLLLIITLSVCTAGVKGAILRSVVELSPQDQPSATAEIALPSKKHTTLIHKLGDAAAAFIDEKERGEGVLSNKEITTPLKHFLISAATRLGIDLLKCAVRGNIKEITNNKGLVEVMVLKAIFQGGMVGGILGAAATWGNTPQPPTGMLLEHEFVAQMILEFIENIGMEVANRGAIDELTWLYSCSVLAPLVVASLQGWMLQAVRKDMWYEKKLLQAAIRELRAD